MLKNGHLTNKMQLNPRKNNFVKMSLFIINQVLSPRNKDLRFGGGMLLMTAVSD